MIIERMRKEIRASGKSLNRIGRETGIDKAALSRIMNGGSCKAETLETLLDYFGYEIRRKRKMKGMGVKE
jgi:transcriptional regulator with XRE-family HTH domain